MATKFAPPPLTFTLPARPNITVAFVAGPAQVAALDATAKLPEADRALDDLIAPAESGDAWRAARSIVEQAIATREHYHSTVMTPANARHNEARSSDVGKEAAFAHVQACEAEYGELVHAVTTAAIVLGELPAPNQQELLFKLKVLTEEEFHVCRGFEKVHDVLAADSARLLTDESAPTPPIPDRTFDKAALAEATRQMMTAVSSYFDRDFSLLLVNWLSASVYNNIAYSNDAEGLPRCAAELAAIAPIEKMVSSDPHILAVQAYMNRLFDIGAPSFGPAGIDSAESVADRLLRRFTDRSPVPGLIDAWASTVWTSSTSRGALDQEVGFPVLEALEKARDVLRDQKSISRTGAWREAHERYLRARTRFDAIDLDDPMSEGTMVRMVDAQDRLFETIQSPTVSALATKLELVAEKYGGMGLPRGLGEALVADAKRLAAQLEPVA